MMVTTATHRKSNFFPPTSCCSSSIATYIVAISCSSSTYLLLQHLVQLLIAADISYSSTSIRQKLLYHMLGQFFVLSHIVTFNIKVVQWQDNQLQVSMSVC